LHVYTSGVGPTIHWYSRSMQGRTDAASVSAQHVPSIQHLLSPKRFSPAVDPDFVPHSSSEPYYCWTGGDVDSSVALTPRYTAFVYGDTLLGSWDPVTGRRSRQPLGPNGLPIPEYPPDHQDFGLSPMPHSSVGVFDHETKWMRYHYGPNHGSFFHPPWLAEDGIDAPCAVDPTVDSFRRSTSGHSNRCRGPPSRTDDAFWGTAVSTVDVTNPSGSIYVFGVRVAFGAPGHTGALDFDVTASWVCRLDGVLADPSQPLRWRQSWSRLPDLTPHSVASLGMTTQHEWIAEPPSGPPTIYAVEWNNGVTQQVRTFGRHPVTTSGADPLGDYHYIFGTLKGCHDAHHSHGRGGGRCHRPPGPHHTQQIVARIENRALRAFDWPLMEYWSTAGRWQPISQFVADPTSAEPVWSGPAVPEFSVCWSPLLRQYFTLFLDAFGTTVRMRVASQLQGPWHELATGTLPGCPVTLATGVYSLPPPFNDPSKVFCYAVKIHPALQGLIPHNQGQAPMAVPVPRSDVVERYCFSFVGNAFHAQLLFDPSYSDVYVPQFEVLTIAGGSAAMAATTADSLSLAAAQVLTATRSGGVELPADILSDLVDVN
jgi:hypothetical protein